MDERRLVESPGMGRVSAIPKVRGLHHYYTRLAVLPLLRVGKMTLRLYGALSYSQNSARDLRFALNGA